MKRFIKMAAVLISGCLGSAQAEGWYLGASVGVMDVDISGYDEATNAGVLIGYDVFTKEIFATSLEAEFTTSVSDGDLKVSGARGDWDIDTRAAYVAFRLGEDLYLKARYGFSRTDTSTDIEGAPLDGTDSGVSWGGAAGWMFSRHWGIQADGTQIESNVTYWNLGVKYRF